MGQRVKRIAVVLFICCIVLPMGMRTVKAAEDEKVKVGCFPLNGFFNIAEDGTVSGYGAEYTDAVLAHTDWDYEYVIYSSWVEALAALSNNEIDLLAPSQRTSEREAQFAFTSFPMGTEYGSLLALSTNDNLIYEDFRGFDGLHVGCVESLVFRDSFEQYEKNNNFSVNYSFYKDTPALVAALHAGEVDAIVVNMMVKTDAMKLLARFGSAPIYYMLSEEASDLAEELNLSIDKETSNYPELQNELSEEYFSSFNHIPFSKEELDYVSHSGVIKIACGSQYAPFSYINEETGEIDGSGRALMERLSEISGLTFEYVPIPAEGDAASYLQKEGVMLVAGVESDEYTHSQVSESRFSDNYLSVSKYFVGLKTADFDLNEKLKIAVVSYAGAHTEAWNELYPDFTFEKYTSIDEGIAAIHQGKADFLLENRYSMEYVLSDPHNQDLMIFPEEGITSNICFQVLASGEEAKLLSSVLDKSISQISQEEKELLISNYAQENRYRYSLSDFLYMYRIQVGCAAVMMILLFIALLFVYKAKRKSRIAIEENEMKLRNITNNIKGGVIVLKADEGLEITFANEGFLEMIGCSREQFEQNEEGSYLAYVHPNDLGNMQAAIDSEQKELSLELRVMKVDGSYVPALFNGTVSPNNKGEKALYCVIMDLTEQNKLLERLRIENRRTELILERVDEIFYEMNLQDHSITTSLSFYDKLGWRLPERIPENQRNQCREMWHTGDGDIEKLRESLEEIKEKKTPVSTIVQMESKIEGRFVWCEVLQHPIMGDDGTIISIIGLIRNIDAQVKERERLKKKAMTDPLTGLYNKAAFETLVKETLMNMPGKNHALIFIDMDHFKALNDTCGHMVGDRAICEAADKLKVIFSNFDLLSRFGGDEFCIFVKDIPTETLKGKMEWLVDKLHQEYQGEKGNVQITCSCGVALTEHVGFEYQTLMKKADDALYYSKENGRDRFTIYSKGGKNNVHR